MTDLFRLDTGTGRPVVLLHGGFLDHTMWDAQIPVLAARYRVLAPDARGHGRSANATAPFRHTDDAAALLRYLDTGPAILRSILVGVSVTPPRCKRRGFSLSRVGLATDQPGP